MLENKKMFIYLYLPKRVKAEPETHVRWYLSLRFLQTSGDFVFWTGDSTMCCIL